MYGKFMYINIDLKIDTAGNESNGPMFRCNTHTYISWTTSAMQIYIYIYLEHHMSHAKKQCPFVRMDSLAAPGATGPTTPRHLCVPSLTKEREINNGRFAMFAALGIISAELYTGKDAIEQFGL